MEKILIGSDDMKGHITTLQVRISSAGHHFFRVFIFVFIPVTRHSPASQKMNSAISGLMQI